MRPSLVISFVALVVALGGTSYAAVKLSKNSVRSTHIKNGQVKKADIGRDAVDSQRIVNGTVTAADLAPGTVTKGEKGDKGDTGPAGATGAPGSSTIAGEVKVTNAVAEPVPVTPAGERRFTIVRRASSNLGIVEECTPITGLPAGDLLIEHIHVLALANMVVDLELSTTDAANGAYFVPVPLTLASRPNSNQWIASIEPGVVVRDGASEGELFRSADRPARLCVQDTTQGSNFL